MNQHASAHDDEAVSWAPLTEAQAGLWYAQRLDPGNPIFNTGHCTDIHSPLDLDCFAQAVNQTLDEAQALSLRMADLPEGPAQRIDPAHRPQLEIRDLSHDPQGRATAQACVQQDLARAIDPTRNPLARQVLFILGPTHYLWYQRVHHLAADGYGMALIEGRSMQRYRALTTDDTTHDRPLASITELWDEARRYGESPRREQDRAFWLETMRDAEPAGSLAPEPALSDHNCLRAEHDAPESLIDALHALEAATEVSWPDILGGLTAAYIGRHTGQSECIVGIPYMGRLGSAGARIVATVMNVVPWRARIEEDIDLKDFLRQTERSLRTIRRHSRYRGEQLRRDLGLLGGMRRLHGPIINILPFDAPYEQAGLDARQTVLCTGPVEDLTFSFRARSDAGGLRIEIEANPKLYTAEQIAHHLARLTVFLGAALRAERLAEVPTLTPEEHRHWIHAVNDTAHPVPDTSLWSLIQAQLESAPDRIGLVYGDLQMDYGQIDTWTAAVAAQLHAAGVRRGDLVAVAMPRSPELVLSLPAILRAGAAYLPLDIEQPVARLAQIIDSARPRLLLGDPALVAGLGVPSLQPDPSNASPVASTACAPRPEDPAYVIYTSGSTGEPKGVVVGHAAIVNRLEWMRRHYDVGSEDRILQKTPATFDVSVWEFFLPFISGARLVIAPPDAHKDPAWLCRLVREHGISILHFVPSMLAAILDEPDAQGLAARLVFCSGEALPAAIRDRFHQTIRAELHNLYGPTEAAVDVSYWPADADDRSQPVPIGTPVWNTALYILDERLRPVPPGVPGQLYLAGRQLAQGYLGRPDLTAQRFIPNPWPEHGPRIYATGDIATRREDGAVVYQGRSDHQVKLRGQRIELGEIEAALARHPAISQVAVLMREDRPGDQVLVAYLVPATNSRPDAHTLSAYTLDLLPAHMVPGAWVWLDALPVTANGKLDRKALPAPQMQTQAGGRIPATATERLVASRFRDVLEHGHDIHADDDFFVLGGHSLLAAKLALRLRADLNIPLSLGAVFEHPTVARLAACLDARGTQGAGSEGFGPVITLRPATAGTPPLFCIHPAGGLAWCYGGLARALPADRGVHGIQAGTLALDGTTAQTSLAAMAAHYADTIVSLQAEGPYHLAGWSVGGIIAQAIAVELQGRGLSVGALALLDAYPSDAWRNQPEPPPEAVYKALLHIAGADPDTLPAGTLNRDGVIGYLRRNGHPLGELSDDRLDAVFELVGHNNCLVREHHHQPYIGAALHFRAALDHADTGLHPDLWQPWLPNLTVYDLPALHAHLTGPQAVARIAPILAAQMHHAESTASSVS
ncbi:MAG: amino acid adenylation domain-containing protein [Alcaligenaceae bacterium]|nr:amino acid adenylation domain-containing protein [Alcaligenaceae bacterium]